jgi:hypothetical protein
MKIRILQHLIGPEVNLMAGDTVDMPDGEAARLVASGIAEAVTAPAKDERATSAEPARKATRR